MPIAEHMMRMYDETWPNHPLTFLLPDGSASRSLAGRFDERLRLVPTREGEGRGQFRGTVLDLLGGIDDDTWVYWCMDDRYPVSVNAQVFDGVVSRLDVLENIDALSLCQQRYSQPALRLDRSDTVRVEGHTFVRRTTYHRIWNHQFVRTKVLRHLFEGFPEHLSAAGDMDDYKNAMTVPEDHRLYVSTESWSVFGESTRRGHITANCAASMDQRGGIPEGFPILPVSVYWGRPLPRLDAFLGRVRRQFAPWRPRLGRFTSRHSRRA